MSRGPLVGGVSPEALDYLLGAPAESVPLSPPEAGFDPPQARAAVRVCGVAQPRRSEPPKPGEPWVYPSEAMLAGLAGEGIPVAFTAEARGAEASFELGTWGAPGSLDVVTRLAQAPYRAVSYDEADVADAVALRGRWVGGIALGVPDPPGPDPVDGAAAWDRLLRAVAGSHCAATVLAEPIAQSELRRLRHKVIDELRAVVMAEQPMGVAAAQPPPLAKHYTAVLEQLLALLNDSLTAGGWRVGVYLTGAEAADFWQLAAAWRSTFTGEKSIIQPLRTARRDEAAALAASWSLPYHPPAHGPGSWRHPFEAQTLLSTKQLAGYVHLPRLEAPGFAVSLSPSFDAVPPSAARSTGAAEPDVLVGAVVHRDEPTTVDYRIPLRGLTRHALVSGVTGGGKTNTVFQLLDQADRHGVPFLVIEPAKAEYRSLVAHPRIGPRLNVFTAGDETVAPIRINPFAPMAGAPLGAHVDMLRSLFTAAWSLWEPLPQVLEQAVHEVYRAYGWDLATGRNGRLRGEPAGPDAYPTITDLVDAVEGVVARLRFDPEAEGRVRASLVSRLESLRVGAKGRMLDTRAGTPAEVLFEQPTVLELERLGDESDRAFVMGLMLVQLGEYRRSLGYTDDLRHLLVLEEAHRLLATPAGSGGKDQGDPAGKAVEGFVNLLAEVRVYGQGVVIADQVPVKLHPDAIKNTNLKITHRLLANDDRAAIAGATAMTDDQAAQLPTLRAGQAAVFSQGDDGPVLVAVPEVKDLRDAPGDGALVRQAVDGGECPAGCQAGAMGCEAAAAVASAGAVRAAAARAFVSALADPKAATRLWPDVLAVAARSNAAAGDVDPGCLAVRLARRWAGERGAAHRWSFREAQALADEVAAAVLGRSKRLAKVVAVLHDPAPKVLPLCSTVCGDAPCLYRFDVAAQVAKGRHRDRWATAESLPLEQRYGQLYEVGLDVADHLVEGEAAAARAAMCFAQQMVLADERRGPTEVRFALERLLERSAT